MRLAWLLLLLATCANGKSYYDVLGVAKGATDAQIKKAYRKLAVQFHPDKQTGSESEKAEAASKFTEIGAAYEVLSVEETRRVYDRYGEEGLKQHNQQQQQGGRGGGDIFSQFFGGFGGGRQQEEMELKGDDVYVELQVTLQDLYLGREIEVSHTKVTTQAAAGTRKCKCRNQIVTKQVGNMFQQYQQKVCQDCPNVKLVRETETHTVVVDAGMRDGQDITLFEEGEPHVDGDPGDLKFVINTVPDSRFPFTRTGSELMLDMTITLTEALVGFRRELTHMDGHKFTIQNEGVTYPGLRQQYRGEGMPTYGNEHIKGSLFVTYSIAFPRSLTKAQKDAVKALKF